MPLAIGAFLTAAFAWIVKSEVLKIGRKLLGGIAYVFVVGALSVLVIAALNALTSGLAATLPAGVTAVLEDLMPGNTATCLGVISTAKGLLYLHQWHLKLADKMTA